MSSPFRVEDGFSESLESNPTNKPRNNNESGHNSVRMMMSSETNTDKELVSFEGDEKDSKGLDELLEGANALNYMFFKEIGNEKILKEIFLTCAEKNNTIPFLTMVVVVKEEKSKNDDSFPWSTCKKNLCHEYEDRIPFNDDCLEKSASPLFCNKGMKVELNIHGKGVCVCREGFITIIESNKFPHCYQELLQGPCEEGEQLIRNEITQKPECLQTECQFANQTKWSTGECLETVFCGDDGIVVFQGGKLDCTVAVRQLISVPSICGDGESKDASGNCKEIHDNFGRNSRSPSGKINFNKNTLKRLMCSKHPNKFNC
ncbi:unnamed protein product [Lepeophtheirus salmonis]|uniref:(salmon louse) hypothetical protein n=1 Tax=Lepeophtheirus salmonis TaxID=72036 RepID=A0A7R8HAT3_LEPSM|nr:unnamed protein product [Lepeophtheirus salmonis]CAF2975768.1 unnamed protein product [Lepeophtheirus salmonis]